MYSTILVSMVDTSVVLPKELDIFYTYTCMIGLYAVILWMGFRNTNQLEDIPDTLLSIQDETTSPENFNSNSQLTTTPLPHKPINLNNRLSLVSTYEPPGYLHLIVGPMYAGKSTELLRHIRAHQFLKRNMYVVNHAWNMRYNTCGVSTHSGDTFQDCAHTMYLLQCEMDPSFVNSKYVFIEELQFFPDAVETVTRWVNQYKKCVYAAALNSDYLQNGFVTITPLYAQADEIQHVTAYCTYCNDGTRAPFTYKMQSRIGEKNENATPCKESNTIVDNVVEVGGKDVYAAVCRHHYMFCMESARIECKEETCHRAKKMD